MISGVEKTKQLVSSYHDYIITVILKNSVTCEWSNFHKSNFYFIARFIGAYCDSVQLTEDSDTRNYVFPTCIVQ